MENDGNHLSIKADDFPLSETDVIFCCQTSDTPKLQRDHLVVGVIDAQACAPRWRGRWRWGNCDRRDPTWLASCNQRWCGHRGLLTFPVFPYERHIQDGCDRVSIDLETTRW